MCIADLHVAFLTLMDTKSSANIKVDVTRPTATGVDPNVGTAASRLALALKIEPPNPRISAGVLPVSLSHLLTTIFQNSP